MDKDRINGVGARVAGSVKEAIGKVTGDTHLEAEGTAQTAAGKAQNAVCSAKDVVRETVKE